MLAFSKLLADKQRLGQRGDTIVEVLIATAIVSMVLTTAYTITNRNIQTEQNIQEQTQAQELVSRQLELLRLETGPLALPTCYLGTNETAPTLGDCKMTAAGVPLSASPGHTGAIFNVEISVDPADTNVYVVSATWEKLGGQESSIKMYYFK